MRDDKQAWLGLADAWLQMPPEQAIAAAQFEYFLRVGNIPQCE
jgi:hypothetical protein